YARIRSTLLPIEPCILLQARDQRQRHGSGDGPGCQGDGARGRVPAKRVGERAGTRAAGGRSGKVAVQGAPIVDFVAFVRPSPRPPVPPSPRLPVPPSPPLPAQRRV